MAPTIKIMRPVSRFCFLCAMLLAVLLLEQHQAFAQAASPQAPVVNKVEPPNWWVGLTPEVQVLLYGKNLSATRVSCNLLEVQVGRTQSSADGNYLFVWLELGAKLKSGTVVCRVTAESGTTSFELPIAARKQILGRNQGISLDDVIYRVVPDRFADGDPLNDEPEESSGAFDRSKPRAFHGGDLRGLREHLPYLKELGVTAVSLAAILKSGAGPEFSTEAATDLYAVDPHLGELKDYQELITAAHQAHLKVFFDLALDHVAAQHSWAANPPEPNWFHGTKLQHPTAEIQSSFYGLSPKRRSPNDYLDFLQDPHTPQATRHNLTDSWRFGAPALNLENPNVIQYITQNSIWWAETSGLDAYRLDNFGFVPRSISKQWHAALRRLYPRLSTIGEVVHPNPTVTSFFAGGRLGWDGIDTGLSTVLDFPMYFALRDVLLNDAPAGSLASILRDDSLYPHPNFLVNFVDEQNFPRNAGLNLDKLKLATGLALTLRGIPEIYSGDEIGLDSSAGNNRKDFPGGWMEDRQSAFTQEGRTREQQEVFAYVQKLLHLRQEHQGLRGGALWHLYSDDFNYVFVRESEEEKLLVAFHKGPAAGELRLPLLLAARPAVPEASLLFGRGSADLAGTQIVLQLPANSLSIFLLH